MLILVQGSLRDTSNSKACGCGMIPFFLASKHGGRRVMSLKICLDFVLSKDCIFLKNQIKEWNQKNFKNIFSEKLLIEEEVKALNKKVI